MTVADTARDEVQAQYRVRAIQQCLDSIADNYETVLPLIREAIEADDATTLGYRSVSEYVSECFGGSLTRLAVEVRREVVRELTDAGMSSRAIAPVVGVSHEQVRQDALSGVKSLTPGPEQSEATAAHAAAGTDVPPAPAQPTLEREPATPTPPRVTGLDGKSYPATKPKSDPLAAARDKAKSEPRVLCGKAIDRFRDATKTIRTAGGVEAIVKDSDDLDAMAGLWLPDVEQALQVLNELRAVLRRQQIRSV